MSDAGRDDRALRPLVGGRLLAIAPSGRSVSVGKPGRMLPRPRSAGAQADAPELPITRADLCSPSKHASEPDRPSPGARRAVSHPHASPSAARDDPFRRLAATRRVIALATFR